MQTVVELSRLRHNIRRIRARLNNGFCAVVKAQAYGHGAAVAPYIEPVVDCFMTATYAEARELVGITKPILVMSGEIDTSALDPRMIPAVSTARDAELMIRSGCKRFSVAVNTGMNRLGARPDELERIVSVCRMYGVKPWSVYSHLYGGISSAAVQADEFEQLTADEPILCGRRHLYSSCALGLAGYKLFDMTRCGIAMYGFSDVTEPAIRVRARIVAISYVPRGEHIGYGDVTLDRDALVATVRCGYADGLRRTDRPLYLKVRGVKCPVIGVPCMDLCMIDVSRVPCRVGEFAYLVSDRSDVEYLAKVYDTITYEVLTGFNGRAERIYM